MASSSKVSNSAVRLPLIAATVALPVLAYVALNSNSQNGNSRNGKDLNKSVHSTVNRNGQSDNDAINKVTVVPEANAGWVLVPFFGAVLLFSARQLLRGKATE